MRLAAGIALAMAAAAPASAHDTVARGGPTAGPVIAGDGVAWADRTDSGAVRVITMRRGGRPVVRRRWAASGAARTTRSIGDVAAGPGRLAAVVETCTRATDRPYSWCKPRAFSGPFASLRGPRLPRRVDERCSRGARNVQAVAVGGGWVATVLSPFCVGGGAEASAGRTRIVARRGSRRITIPVGYVEDLSLAGHHLAWIDGDGRAVQYDLRRGELARRVGGAVARVAGLDVQADGALALGRFARGGACFSLAPLGSEERAVGCHGGPTAGEGQVGGGGGGGGGASAAVAVAAGRLLYDRGSELVLQEPGGPARVVARFPPRFLRRGEFDLGEQGATWAQQRLRSGSGVGPPRVVLRSL